MAPCLSVRILQETDQLGFSKKQRDLLGRNRRWQGRPLDHDEALTTAQKGKLCIENL